MVIDRAGRSGSDSSTASRSVRPRGSAGRWRVAAAASPTVGIEHDAGQISRKSRTCLVGGPGHREPEVLQVATRPGRTPRARQRSNRSIVSSATSTSGLVEEGRPGSGSAARSGIRWRAWFVDRRAIWARNFSRFGVSVERPSGRPPSACRKSRFSMVARIASAGVGRGGLLEPGQAGPRRGRHRRPAGRRAGPCGRRSGAAASRR